MISQYNVKSNIDEMELAFTVSSGRNKNHNSYLEPIIHTKDTIEAILSIVLVSLEPFCANISLPETLS